MNAVSIIGVVSAFSLLFLSLLVLCAEKGIHPLGRIRKGFRRLPGWKKALILIFVSVWIAFAGTKDGSNGVDQVEGETNTVTQVEGGTNQMENGELRIDNAGGVFSILRSPFSILHSNAALPGNAITGDDVERMFRVATTFDVNSFAEPTANAVTNAAWLDYGGMSDTFRLLPEGWRFPFADTTTAGLTVFQNGDFRPNVKTHFFPPPFDAKLSLLPRMNWGLLPNGCESVFWHEQTPSNSLVLTWHNALYNRDVNCPTNFQAELFADGRFDYRYPDRTVQYAPVFPFDWDGDGLENSVDLEPLVAGPDAHGTNAEWFNNVCSNVFAATENADGGVELAPRSSSVKTNAYYFVEVVTADGPAPIYFNGSQPGRLGYPVVIACAGETNHVPLLIGVEYAVTSPAPFTVSVPTNGFVEMRANNGYSSNYTVKWPLEFTFTEGFSESSRTYTVDVGPYDPGGTFTWGGASLQNVPLPSGGGEDSCNCVSGVGNTLTFGCSSTCTCGGHCRARGWYRFELLSFAVEGGACRCGFDDPPPFETPAFNPLDGPSVTVAFSAPAVIFEEAYVDKPGVSQPRRSTRTRLLVSAWGGPNGGTLDLTSQNLDKLSPVACGPMVLPSQITLGPNQPWSISFLCEGVEESSLMNDVVVSGSLTDSVTGLSCTNHTELTILRVEFSPQNRAPLNPLPFRHKYGIGERMNFKQIPAQPSLSLTVAGGMENLNLFGEDGDKRYIIWSLLDEPHSVACVWNDVEYCPLVTVVCPTGIETRNEHWMTNGLPTGVAGGICLVQEFYVQPLDVSFSALSIEEVPCFDVIPSTGYYVSVTGRWEKSHTVAAGAGRWRRVTGGNRVGGEGVVDSAGMLGALPRVDADGHETDDPQCGWCSGYMIWKIPFGWQSSVFVWPSAAPQLGTFAEDTRQTFTISDFGDYKVRKFANEAERKIDGTIYFNGARVK